MKLALEALKDNQHLVADNERHAYVMKYNAIIEKLEEALEKQEQRSDSEHTGEPVAWVDSLFAELKHGDEDHQLWLYEKLKSWALNNQEKQLHDKPVAWRWGVPKLKNGKFEWRYSINKTRKDAIPLYTKEKL
jgi:hypothetical protein